jgi:NADH-quinone oxidoreductase subunit C
MLPEELRENPVAAALEPVATTGAVAFGELTIEIEPSRIVDALRIVKHELRFERLTSVTGVDRFPVEPRFEVVYHLQSISRGERLRLKVRLPGENPEVESATHVYRSANWYERETFDLFGVRFLNHPDLTRILMPEDWPGHPLRKDYSVTGTRY